MSNREIPRRTDKELAELAIDIFSGNVFHSAVGNLSPHELGIIFMPVGLGALEEYRENFKDIGLIYEYLSKSESRQLNGYPTFFSCHILHKDDLFIVTKKLDALEEAASKLSEGG